jgi:hypothetical protein
MKVEGVEDGEVWFSEGDTLSRFETGPGTWWTPASLLERLTGITSITGDSNTGEFAPIIAFFSFLLSRASPSSSFSQRT